MMTKTTIYAALMILIVALPATAQTILPQPTPKQGEPKQDPRVQQLLWDGRTALRNHNPEAALQRFGAALRLDPSSVAAYYDRGEAYWQLKDYKNSTADFSKATELNPKYGPAYWALGRIAHEQGDTKQAAAYMDQALRANPGDVNYARELVNFRMELQDWPGAMSATDKLLAGYDNMRTSTGQKPTDSIADVHVLRGLCMLGAGKSQEAQQEFSQATALDPSLKMTLGARIARFKDDLQHLRENEQKLDAAGYLKRGLERLTVAKAITAGDEIRCARIKEAIADLSKAIEMQPNDAVAYAARADGLLSMVGREDLIGMSVQERRRNAQADLDKALSLDPKDAKAHFARARLYATMGNATAARRDYDDAAALEPNNIEYQLLHGFYALNANDYDAAAAAYAKVLELDPTRTFAREFLARARAGKGDWAGAVADYTAYLHAKPDDSGALVARGRCLAKLHRDSDALADFKEAVRINPRLSASLAAEMKALER